MWNIIITMKENVESVNLGAEKMEAFFGNSEEQVERQVHCWFGGALCCQQCWYSLSVSLVAQFGLGVIILRSISGLVCFWKLFYACQVRKFYIGLFWDWVQSYGNWGIWVTLKGKFLLTVAHTNSSCTYALCKYLNDRYPSISHTTRGKLRLIRFWLEFQLAK